MIIREIADTGLPRIIIRRMKKSDLPQVLEIEKNCFGAPWSEPLMKEYCEEAADTESISEIRLPENTVQKTGIYTISERKKTSAFLRLGLVAERMGEERKTGIYAKTVQDVPVRMQKSDDADGTSGADFDKKNILGFICMLVIPGEADVDNIAVSKESRGLGLGRMLLRAGIDECEKLGINDFTLEVRAGNKAAIGLYESEGFVREGIRKVYYDNPKEDAHIYWRHEQNHS